MMRRRTTVAAVVAVSAGIALAAVSSRAAFVPDPGVPAPGFSERADRDVQIRVWHSALDADPNSALVLGQLAALHLQRAREGGAWDDYLTAEQYARRSIGLRTRRNGSTAATLANILLAQHRFADARAVAESLVARESDVPQYHALLGEIDMELGLYDEAGRLFSSLWSERTHLSIAPRLARWAELRGDVRLAGRLLDSAGVDAQRRRDVPRETKAWFELRRGELAARSGKARAARSHFLKGLAIEPGDPRLLAALARLALQSGRAREAIAFANRAIASQLDPEMLGVAGFASLQLRDTTKAAEYFEAMDVALSSVRGPFHRAWSLQLLARGAGVENVVQHAAHEYESRKDVYGADLYAWALHSAGRDREAAPIMREAMRLGSVDPLLLQHAAAISRASRGER
jgi:tetratricopeptide (TPR) repeat protein